MNARADVVVVGGGISGLAAAYSARRAGACVLLLEAQSNAGGVMQTDDTDGFVVERGPTSMAATAQSMRLLHELGLMGDVVSPPKSAARRYVVRNGKMHALPSSPTSLFSTDLLTSLGKLRLLAEPFVQRLANTDYEETLAELVRRRFGQEVLDYVVDPFVSGVCAGDATRLSSRHVLRIAGELEREFGSVLLGAVKRARQRKDQREGHIVSLRHGMNQLPQAFHRALDGVCAFDTRLVGVSQMGEQISLSCEIQGIRTTIVADAMICALPSHRLPSIDWPDEWRDNITQLSTVPYAPICTVALGFRRADVSHPLDGFGVLFPSAEKRGILGALFNSSMFDGRAPSGHVLITAFVGGAKFGGAGAGLSEQQCIRAALDELTPLLGLSGEPTLTKVARWEQGIPQLEVGHHHILGAATAIENGASRVFFTGSYLGGPAVGDCLTHGMQTGARAAAFSMNEPLPVEYILARPTAAFL
ncbi:MAG: protoporphyrinogen oxidase [Gemmatimonadaceae bacterium]